MLPIAGGTDLMVELNFDRRRPARMMDLNRVRELDDWHRDDGDLVIGAGVTCTRLVEELAGAAPGLAIAARTVGSPRSATGERWGATWAPPPPPATSCRR